MKRHEWVMKTQQQQQMGGHFRHTRSLREVKSNTSRLHVTNKARRGTFDNPRVTKHERCSKWLPVATKSRLPRVCGCWRDHCAHLYTIGQRLQCGVERTLCDVEVWKRDAGAAILVFSKAVNLPSESWGEERFRILANCDADEPRSRKSASRSPFPAYAESHIGNRCPNKQSALEGGIV